MNETEARVRHAIYRWFLDHGRAPGPAELAAQLQQAPADLRAIWQALASEHDAIVLLPDSDYLWMAEPFSAVATDYRAVADDGRSWFGNCAWDALGVLAVAGGDGRTINRCKASGTEIVLTLTSGDVSAPAGTVAHFAVPAREWWRSIGFT